MIAIARMWSVIAPSVCLAVVMMFIAGAAHAQNLPWCAIMDNDGTTQCNFSTLQQCLQTLSGIGGRCQTCGLLRKWRARLMYCNAAEQAFGQIQLVIPFRRDALEHANGFARYFGSDPVTGKYQYVEVHEFT